MAATKSRGLGKGLEALFGDIEINTSGTIEQEENSVQAIAINDIKPNAKQPRKFFDDEKIEELADSIKIHGIIQPIVLKKEGEGFEIIAGERRWRAARKAGLKQVPCIIKELTSEQNLLISIIENIQREDLNPIEEAEALNQMISTFGLTQEQVSRSVGKSRPYITNALRLLKLPEEIRQMVVEGKLSNGHARTLIGITDSKRQLYFANKAVSEELSVREIERLVKEDAQPKEALNQKKVLKSPDVLEVERELKEVFGTKVTLQHKGAKGKIQIDYYSRDELERLIELMKSLK